MPGMAHSKKLIVGNWKMKPATLKEAKQILGKIEKGVAAYRKIDVVVCPPQPAAGVLRKESRSRKLAFGAQDCFWERAASQTGESSPALLKGLGLTHVIIGHSERRTRGETNDEVNRKVHAALAEGLTPIICFGETARDKAGNYVTFLTDQLTAALSGLSKAQVGSIVIAYEPLWAIGKSAAESAVTPTQVHEMVIFVRKHLAGKFGRTLAESVPVLYGGSVESANCGPLLFDGHADGLLIGHSSIVPGEFLEILAIANEPPRV